MGQGLGTEGQDVGTLSFHIEHIYDLHSQEVNLSITLTLHRNNKAVWAQCSHHLFIFTSRSMENCT